LQVDLQTPAIYAPAENIGALPFRQTGATLAGSALELEARSGLTQAAGDPDEDLVIRAGLGEGAAVRALVMRKLPRLLALAGRLLCDAAEAEDVAQEVLLRVWRQAPQWRPGAARFDTWMHRVALNLCYDRLRRRRGRPLEDAPEPVDPGPAPDRGLNATDVGKAVGKAMAALPDRQREAIVLCHYQEMSNIEAAELMGLSVEALESLLSRGRRSLRAKLADWRTGGVG
jgi:RNA polymerase sigma factor (sigma-70 family)